MARAPVLVVTKLDAAAKAAFYKTADEWVKAELALSLAAAAEKEKRDALIALIPGMTEGTNTVGLGFGKSLKIDCRINRSLDKAHLDTLQTFAAVIPDPALPPDAPEVAALRAQVKALLEELIVYKPDLSVTAFKALNDDQKKIVGDLVTEKLGSYGIKLHTEKA